MSASFVRTTRTDRKVHFKGPIIRDHNPRAQIVMDGRIEGRAKNGVHS